MPPEGYETVTLPASINDRLESMTDRPGLESRQDVIRFLLDDRQAAERGETLEAGEVAKRLETVEAASREATEAAQNAQKAVEELAEGRR